MDETPEQSEGPGARDRKTWDAAAVAELRRRMGLSQARFAAELGVRQQTVSEWETGQYRPRGASVRLLTIVREETAAYDARPPDEREDG